MVSDWTELIHFITLQFSSVQSLSCVRLFATPWICISEVIDTSPSNLDSSCASSSPVFLMMYSVYKLNKEGDNYYCFNSSITILLIIYMYFFFLLSTVLDLVSDSFLIQDFSSWSLRIIKLLIFSFVFYLHQGLSFIHFNYNAHIFKIVWNKITIEAYLYLLYF